MISKFQIILILSLTPFFLLSQNVPPTISISETQTYCVGVENPIVSTIDIDDTDPGDDTLDEISIQISEGYQIGQDLLSYNGSNPNINAVWSQNQGSLTLEGPATFLEFENAVLNVVFTTTQQEFDSDKSISINLGNANFLPTTGHYYFYVSDIGITWTEAKAAAEAQTYFGLQGYLATITSIEEAQLAGEQSTGTGWIGGSDQQQEGTWIWETGPEQGDIFWIGQANGNAPNGAFSFWNNNEPNQAGDEDYAHVTDPSIGNPGSWNDLSNTGDTSGPYQPKGYVVEFGGLPGEPEVNLSASLTMIMPQNSVDDLEACDGETYTITPNSNADTLEWYATETSSDIINVGESFTTQSGSTSTFWIQPIYVDCQNLIDRIPVTVTINQNPTLNPITISECTNNQDLFTADFNLNSYVDLITEGSGNENLTVNFYEDEGLTQLITEDIYTNTENFQSIYVEVINPNTQCQSSVEVTLEVIYNDLGSTGISNCDADDNDGITLFDLSEANQYFIEQGQAGPDNSVVFYYETIEDALAQQNELPTDYENIISGSQDIFARVNVQNGCLGLGILELTVNDLPVSGNEETVVYCIDTFPDLISIDAGISDDLLDEFDYEWSTEETTPAIQINEAGVYSVNITNEEGCSTERLITVEASEQPIIDDVIIEDFSANNSITILASNSTNSELEYSLDGENYQDSNLFSNLSEFDYTVYVRDKDGCGVALKRILLLDYPQFFTPNGDGFNDTWQIINGDQEIFSKIYIFDRYGKLVANIKSFGNGWDGTFNGKAMPSNDYWFRLEREDGRIYTGNFTLKR
jgi:gliding motility-associated-like protein